MRLRIESGGRLPESANSWKKRVPEPKDRREGALEYDLFAANSFAESDKAYAVELAGLFPIGANVVDMGCGPAAQDLELVRLRPDIHVFALDYSPEMLEIAEKKAKTAGVLDRFTFVEGDATKLIDANLPHGASIFSNTIIHEVDLEEDDPRRVEYHASPTPELTLIFEGIASVIGDTGGVMLRDLMRPLSEEQARLWRAEVLGEQGDEGISERELELFRNSQAAGYNLLELSIAKNGSPLRGRGRLSHLPSPKSRYWTFEIKPNA